MTMVGVSLCFSLFLNCVQKFFWMYFLYNPHSRSYLLVIGEYKYKTFRKYCADDSPDSDSFES